MMGHGGFQNGLFCRAAADRVSKSQPHKNDINQKYAACDHAAEEAFDQAAPGQPLFYSLTGLPG